MSSNSLAQARAYIHESLEELLPDDFQVLDIEKAGDTFRKLTATYEQGDITSQISGGELPRGVVGVEFVLTLIAPEKQGEAGVSRVSSAVMDLVFALDHMESIAWTTANRVRLSTGESAYRLPITYLATYHPTTEEQ